MALTPAPAVRQTAAAFVAPAAQAAVANAVSSVLPKALPTVQSYELPMQDLAAVAEGSGLQWVNSNSAKIAEVKAAIAAEVKPVHVPRERPASVASTEGPLVLVETKRDLGTLPLPFETPSA